MGDLTNAEPIRFDFGAADRLVAQFRATADDLRAQIGQRDGLAHRARADWRGSYAGKFDARMTVCSRDAQRLADAMDSAAAKVQELARLAHQEQDRRTAARAWKVKHDAWQRHKDSENFLERGWDSIAGDGEPKPPNLTPYPPPTIPIAAPAPQGRG